MTEFGRRGLRILIVEDNKEIRQILHDLLKSSGHDVLVVADGESGLDRLKKNPYDLLITDLGLPGMSGWDLSKASKRYQSNMAILAISSWQGQKAVMKISDYGISQVIWKPFRLDQIKAAIDQIFETAPKKMSVKKR